MNLLNNWINLKNNIFHTKLQGTTLVETLAALTLIVIAFGIGMMIYLQIMASSPIIEKSRVYPMLQSMMEESIYQNDFIDNKKEVEGLLIEKEISAYPNYDNVFRIRIHASLGDKEIMEISRLIHIDNSNKK